MDTKHPKSELAAGTWTIAVDLNDLCAFVRIASAPIDGLMRPMLLLPERVARIVEPLGDGEIHDEVEPESIDLGLDAFIAAQIVRHVTQKA